MTNTSGILGKVGPRQRMIDLVQNGTVFMSEWGSFARDHSDDVRGDKLEGIAIRYSGENADVKIGLSGKDMVPIKGLQHMTVSSHAKDHGIYCMSFFPNPRDAERTIEDQLDNRIAPVLGHRKFATFGTHLVLFHDPVAFVIRLEEAAAKAGYQLDRGPVEYVSSVHCGEWGPFRKLDTYRYQSEYRFVTDKPIKKHLVLTLGSLHDIANIMRFKHHSGSKNVVRVGANLL